MGFIWLTVKDFDSLSSLLTWGKQPDILKIYLTIPTFQSGWELKLKTSKNTKLPMVTLNIGNCDVCNLQASRQHRLGDRCSAPLVSRKIFQRSFKLWAVFVSTA